MCGRYIVVNEVTAIEKRFNAHFSQLNLFEPLYNISIGKLAPVITNDKPKEIQMFQFGLTPFWAKKRMYLFNARSEGDNNKEDDPSYSGGKGIISKPAFRKPIRDQRCLVLCDGFYEGSKTQGLSYPYLFYLKSKETFALAGIWDTWVDESTGEIVKSFAIITTVANELTAKIGHHRSPVILNQNDEQNWLNTTHLASATSMLHPFDSKKMNGFPVSPKVKNPKAEGKELISPIGQLLQPEITFEVEQTLKLQGMRSRKRGKSGNDDYTLADRINGNPSD